ncbi:MAG: hypothetical protein LBL46_01145 [Rickettsiales bacterium]|jgi:hypothetical protein|nr:hypothetical protein [Rickettsiales bacterium]
MKYLTNLDREKLHLDKIGAPVSSTIDCHGLTIDSAFREIERKINDLAFPAPACGGGIDFLGEHSEPRKSWVGAKPRDAVLTIITGRSGDIGRLFRLAIDGGSLADRIKSWTMPNPGCYRIKIRRD